MWSGPIVHLFCCIEIWFASSEIMRTNSEQHSPIGVLCHRVVEEISPAVV